MNFKVQHPFYSGGDEEFFEPMYYHFKGNQENCTVLFEGGLVAEGTLAECIEKIMKNDCDEILNLENTGELEHTQK